LLLFLIGQNVAHGGVGAYELLAAVNVSVAYVWWPVFRCPSVAGFGCPPRRAFYGECRLDNFDPLPNTFQILFVVSILDFHIALDVNVEASSLE